MRPTRRGVVLLAVLAPLLLAASGRKTYVREHRAYTRHLVLYADLRTALIMDATLLEPAFRRALAAERARLVRPSPADLAAFDARMAEDGAATHEIVFAADSAYDDAEKFGAGDDRWNLRLLTDGVEQELVAVERVRTPSPLHHALYPQLDQWSELWIARFTRSIPDPNRIVLIVGSGYGNGELVWEGLGGAPPRKGLGGAPPRKGLGGAPL